MMKKWLAHAGFVLLILYYIYLSFIMTSQQVDHAQGDFRIYYYSAKIFDSGQNPYDMNILCPMANATNYCAYPPFALFFYKLFIPFSYPVAFQLFLILKVLIVVFLLSLWRNSFLNKAEGFLFYIFCFLSFDCVISLDFATGNFNLIEALLLWVAFYFFIKRKFVLFGMLILVASMVKIIPILFLGLFLCLDNKFKLRYLVGFLLGFLGLLFLQQIIFPDFMNDFLFFGLSTTGERGLINPTTYALLGDWIQGLSWIRSPLAAAKLKFFLYFIFCGGVILATSLALRKIKISNMANKELMILFLFCLMYALIHPRFKDYAHVLLIVPSYFIFLRFRDIQIFPIIFIIPILSFSGRGFLKSQISQPFLNEYYMLIIVYFLWGLYLYDVFRRTRLEQTSSAGSNKLNPTIQ